MVLVVLIVYLIGVYVAFAQLLKWASSQDICISGVEYLVLFIYSWLSWAIYIVLFLRWLTHKIQDKEL